MTATRQEPPLESVPGVKRAEYQLSQKSTVSKTYSGKVRRFGKFVDRAQMIKNASSNSNFFTNFDSNPNIASAINQNLSDELEAWN